MSDLGRRARKALELAGLDAVQIKVVEEYFGDDLAEAQRRAAVATFRDAQKRAQARVDLENAARTVARKRKSVV